MELLKGLPLRRTFLAVILNLLALSLSTTALLGSYWCTGTQKVPKPLCGKTKAPQCIGVPIPSDGDASNISSEDSVHYSWETGDDRFAFRYFHTGMWLSCEESLEGTGSVLLRQPQLIALYLLHRSWKLKGGRLRILRRKVFNLFPRWYQSCALLQSLYFCPSLECSPSREMENGCLWCALWPEMQAVKCKWWWWWQWLYDGTVHPHGSWCSGVYPEVPDGNFHEPSFPFPHLHSYAQLTSCSSG